MRLVNRSKRKSKEVQSSKIRFDSLKELISLKSLKCSFISPKEAIETCHPPMINCVKIQSQWNLRLLL